MSDIAIRFATVRFPSRRRRAGDETVTDREVVKAPDKFELDDSIGDAESAEERRETIRLFRESPSYLSQQPNASGIRHAAEAIEKELRLGSGSLENAVLRERVQHISTLLTPNPNSNATYSRPIESLAWSTFLAGSLIEPVDVENVAASGRIIRSLYLAEEGNDVSSLQFDRLAIQIPAAYLEEPPVSKEAAGEVTPNVQHPGNLSDLHKEIAEAKQVIHILEKSLDRRFEKLVWASRRRLQENPGGEDAKKVAANATNGFHVHGQPSIESDTVDIESPWKLAWDDIESDRDLVKRVLGKYNLALEIGTTHQLVGRLEQTIVELVTELSERRIETRLDVDNSGRVIRTRRILPADLGGV